MTSLCALRAARQKAPSLHLWARLDRPVSRNLQIITDLRLFDGDDLYLFKPRKRRFWLRTTAMNDAAAIAGELCTHPEESAA